MNDIIVNIAHRKTLHLINVPKSLNGEKQNPGIGRITHFNYW